MTDEAKDEAAIAAANEVPDTEPVEDEPHDDEPESVPEQAAPARQATSPEEMERKMKALEKQAEKHIAAVARIMGEDFSDLIASPIDFTPGFILNPQLAPLPPEPLLALDVILGRAGVDGFPVDESRERCSTCDGFGMLRTGSRVQNQDALPCRKCMGNGWIEKMQPPASVTALPHAQQPQFGAPTPQPNTVVRDQWGRQQGQERFGLDPAAVGW